MQTSLAPSFSKIPAEIVVNILINLLFDFRFVVFLVFQWVRMRLYHAKLNIRVDLRINLIGINY